MNDDLSSERIFIGGVADRAFEKHVGMTINKPYGARRVAANVAQGSILGAVWFLVEVCGHRRVWAFLTKLADSVMESEQNWPTSGPPRL